jgi:opacity protein-like surface antigen
MKRILAMALALSAAGVVNAASAPTYSQAHDLLVAAIKSGQASGQLMGDIDQAFADQFSSGGRLLATARVLSSFKQAGCKRLELDFTKEDVPTPQGNTEVHLNTQLNYCLDGSPPESLEWQP